jgi:hypothetical protein
MRKGRQVGLKSGGLMDMGRDLMVGGGMVIRRKICI